MTWGARSPPSSSGSRSGPGQEHKDQQGKGDEVAPVRRPVALDEGFAQADQDGPQERAPHPAAGDDRDGERLEDEQRPGVRRQRPDGRHEGAGHAGQEPRDREGPGRDGRGVDPQELGHLAVLCPRAEPLPSRRPAQEEPQTDGSEERGRDDEELLGRQDSPPPVHAGRPPRGREGLRLPAEPEGQRVLHEDEQADRSEERRADPQALQGPVHPVPLGDAQAGDDRDGHRDGEPVGQAEPLRPEEDEIAGDGVERALRQVPDTGDPEDERHAQDRQSVIAAEEEAVEEDLAQVLHGWAHGQRPAMRSSLQWRSCSRSRSPSR